MTVCVCMCVCVWMCERVCVWLCVVYVSRTAECLCACVCMCICDSECVYVCCVCVWVCVMCTGVEWACYHQAGSTTLSTNIIQHNDSHRKYIQKYDMSNLMIFISKCNLECCNLTIMLSLILLSDVVMSVVMLINIVMSVIELAGNMLWAGR